MARVANPFVGFWDRLSPRERNLIMLLVLVFFVMATMVLLVLRSSRLGTTRDEIADMRRALDMLYTQGAVYQERLREKQQREASISSEPLQFATVLEEASTVSDTISVTNMEEQPPVVLTGGLRKRVVEFDLRNVTLEELTRFLAAVEGKPGHVIFTQSLLIRSPSHNEDRLTVDIELATWEREKAGTPQEDKP